MSSLLLYGLQKSAAAVGQAFTLVTEFHDSLELVFLAKYPQLFQAALGSSREAIPFHNTYLGAAALTAASYHPFCWAALEAMISTEHRVFLREVAAPELAHELRADRAVRPSLSFAALAERARLVGLVLLGWQCPHAHTGRPETAHGTPRRRPEEPAAVHVTPLGSMGALSTRTSDARAIHVHTI